MEQGWDPEVKTFFRKIMNTISYGLIWLMSMITAGLYFGLAYPADKPLILTVIFYIVFLVTLVLLIRYFYKTWK